MATPSIADQLKAYQDSLEYANRTAESIRDQRDLLKEVVNQVKRVGVEFNKSTENIGASVGEVKLFQATETDLNNALRDRNVVESSLLKQLKNRAATQQQLDLARRANDPRTSAAALDEINQKSRLIGLQIKAGVISREEGLRQINFLSKIKNNGSQVISNLEKQAGYQDAYINRTKNNLMLENQRLDKLKIQNSFMQVGKKILGDMGPLGNAISDAFSTPNINMWVLAAQATTTILEKAYENFKLFDKASVDVRKNLGALPGQASLIENNLKNVTVELMDIGATFDDVGKSVNVITDEINGLVAQDKDLLKTTTAIAKQFGISESTSAKFLKTLGGISGNSASSQRSMVGFAQKIAVAAGIPLGRLMQDVAEASDDARIYVGNSAISLIKAAAAARMLGTDLNKVAATAEKLLQFESSIGSELKASALLGRNINFNYARQLAFNKDIIGANKEVLRIAKQVNFNQLNPIQQKAFAEAAGKSVSELQDMFQQEKNIALIRSGTNEKAKKALEDYERMMKLKDEEAKNEGKLAEQDILKRANQERLNQLQNKFNQLMSELAKPVMDIVEPLLDIAIKILPTILSVTKVILGVFTALGAAGLITSIGTIFTTLGSVGSVIAGFIPSLGIVATIFTSIGSILTTIGSATILPIIAGVLAIGGAVYEIYNRWSDITDSFKSGDWWGGILIGINAIGDGIIKGLLSPFKFVFNWISDLFMGKSPSKIGLSIVKGITSISTLLLDALLNPFKSALNWLKQIFMGESPSKLGLSIVNGITSIGDMLMDNIKSPFLMAYNYVTSLFSGIGDSIIDGIKSVGSSVLDVLTSPFKSSYNWIMDNLGGKSPSEIGLSILNGMTSVNAKLTDSISNPFKSAFDSILGLAPTDIGLLITTGLKDNLISTINPFKSSLNSVFEDFGKNLSSEIASSITSGLKSSESAIQNSVNTSLSNITLPTTEFKIGEVSEPTTKKIEATNSPIQQVIEVGNQQLIQKIDQLINLMSNGGIAVNLDGQLVSRTLASTTYKSGGFGQSTTRA